MTSERKKQSNNQMLGSAAYTKEQEQRALDALPPAIRHWLLHDACENYAAQSIFENWEDWCRSSAAILNQTDKARTFIVALSKMEAQHSRVLYRAGDYPSRDPNKLAVNCIKATAHMAHTTSAFNPFAVAQSATNRD